MTTRWVSFDCFGTLVDWNTGFDQLLQPWFGARTAEVRHAYHRHERALEAARPHRAYADVLADGLALAATEIGHPLPAHATRLLVDRWEELPVFADVEPMLAELRVLGCRLAVLTNCDDALFARTHASFRRRFDAVVTAEQVQTYKPALAHFREFAERCAVLPGGWVHVACSAFHDLQPASQLKLPCVWLDRENSPEQPPGTWVRVAAAKDICSQVEAYYRKG